MAHGRWHKRLALHQAVLSASSQLPLRSQQLSSLYRCAVAWGGRWLFGYVKISYCLYD
jgi:hypothetical protein